MFPIAHVVAILFKHSKAYPAHGGYRPATKKSKIQNTDRLSLAERIEHPIGHVKVQFLGPVSFFLFFFKIIMLLFCLTSVFQIFCERSLVKIIVDPNSSICSIFFDDVNVSSLFFGKFLSFLIFITSVETSGIAQFLITA